MLGKIIIELIKFLPYKVIIWIGTSNVIGKRATLYTLKNNTGIPISFIELEPGVFIGKSIQHLEDEKEKIKEEYEEKINDIDRELGKIY